MKDAIDNSHHYDDKTYNWECPFCGIPAKGFSGYLKENEYYDRTYFCAVCKHGYKVRVVKSKGDWHLYKRK